MALNKVTYLAGQTVITADNLNEIQDSVINLESKTLSKSDVTTALGYTPAKTSDIPTSQISANTQARHSHTNKATLDKISGIAEVDTSGKVSGNSTDVITIEAMNAVGAQFMGLLPTGYLVWKGAYNKSAVYTENELVSYENGLYRMVSSSVSGAIPGIDEDWEEVILVPTALKNPKALTIKVGGAL